MPRLIRDQDVDTDLPTRVDDELLSRTHVQFPLPGEKSQVDGAIRLFKLARIVSRTLEELYTTTRRRGGVAKIARLQAELDAWERDKDDALSPSEQADEGGPLISPEDTSLSSIFLRVAYNVATIHVHRPALSFTTVHEQYLTSLEICRQASVNIIKTLSHGLVSLDQNQTEYIETTWSDDLTAMLLYPNGVHMLWQAGLTIIFTRLKGYPIPTTETDESIIHMCIDTLRRLRTSHTHDDGDRVRQCADVLDLLRRKVFSDQQALPDLDQLQWNVWDWPLDSALELANTLDAAPLYLSPSCLQP